MNPASHTTPRGNASPLRGGTLARPHVTRTGRFSFRQLAHDLAADVSDPDEAAATSSAARAGAAMHRRLDAESRPFPSVHVDHVAHAASSFTAPEVSARGFA